MYIGLYYMVSIICSNKISGKSKTLSDYVYTKYSTRDCEEPMSRKDEPIEMTGFHNPALTEVVNIFIDAF